MQPDHRVGPPPRQRDERRDEADLVRAGFAVVLTAVSFLTLNTIGGASEGAPAVEGADQLQLILACGILAAGLLFIMHGMMRPRGAPPAGPLIMFLRRAVDVAAAVLWNARGGVGRPLPMPVMILLLYPLLAEWFGFI